MNYQKKTNKELIYEIQELQKKYNSLKATYEKDITGRKQADMTLKENERRFKTLAENAFEGITIINVIGKVTYESPGLSRILGYHPGERIGVEAFSSVHPDDLSRAQESFMHSAEHPEETFTMDLRIKHNDGTWRWIECVGRNLMKDPAIKGIVVNYRDITERKQAEEALIQRQERYRMLYEYAPVGILLVKRSGQILEVNSATIQILGSPSAEATKEINILTFPLLIKAGISDAFKRCVETFQLIIGEYPYITNWGKSIHMQLRFVPIFDEHNRVDMVHTIIEDITERKRIEKELIKSKEKAEESDRLKTAFLQNMSHEIRTPMNAIMGFSELLSGQYNNKANLEKYSKIINVRCNDLLEIINDILDIAKIESGQWPLNIEECNLNELLTELTTFFKEHQKNIGKDKIKLNIQAHCDPTEGTIVTDKVKLKQIFINLINNAFKFTDAGKIEAGCRYDADHNIYFYVSDTGIGIPPDKHEVIFERFSQLRHEKGGTGLGLSIVEGLVDLLGGKIWLESELEKGTTFYFSFPYKISQSVTLEHVSVIESQEYHFPGKTILVVDDDIYNVAYIKEILAHTGLNIIHTEYGYEAVQIAITQSPDLVLMDIRLPDMDGYVAIRQIKQHKPNIKIIAQTAYAAYEDKQKAFYARCNDYISKPIKRNLLLSMINKQLSKL